MHRSKRLFDQLVGADEQLCGHPDAQCFRCLHVDRELVSREAARIITHRDAYRRLVGVRQTGQQQETEQDQSADDVSSKAIGSLYHLHRSPLPDEAQRGDRQR
jgi:hypothetical protein